MKMTVPLFVEGRREPGAAGSLYQVRPLFSTLPQQADRSLSRAMEKLANELRKLLSQLGRDGLHRELARYSFCPAVNLQQVEMRLELQRQMFRGRFPIVTFHGLGRRLAFCPHLFDVWFELARGQTVPERAAEVYARHFRRLEKDGEDVRRQLEPFSHKGQAWLTTLELDVSTKQAIARPEETLFALLGATRQFDGGRELEKVGRCLDWLYPDRLERALHREPLVEQLLTMLSAEDRRPVLLVGPPQVGKTALVHEFIYRTVAERSGIYRSRNNVWLLAPQRLISGMSYVGQWESRLLAILKTVHQRRHILVFDDLLGLFRAGISSSSNLSVADVLKPHVERRQVRVLAEMTPEALRVFRERDRGFADLFQIVPVSEPDEQQTLRMLLAAIRTLEGRHGCRFRIDVLPTVLDLTRRYVRHAAMPGKAARFLSQLAVKYQGREVTRGAALEEFHAKSGLDLGILDTRIRLPREHVVQALRRGIVGQPQALEALADVVSIAKARLNDPSRPLGSLLLLGPTGVGKTQSAKALAGYLFGDPARLMRFDMNQFVTADASARLIGTFDQPEGLLTSAVRRQGFGVVLLDEIEKAHPDVFDLLLQVLGEGRLTDGLGRTADFTNLVILLTSNLGTRQAAQRIGLELEGSGQRAVFVKAAEDFFRPELFNRLDRIVPFQQLDSGEMRQIAQRIIDDVVAREGLVRRRCALQIDEAAIDWVIQRGYDPLLGARAMRRAVEQELVHPVAAQLAALAPDVPTVLRVGCRLRPAGLAAPALPCPSASHHGLHVQITPLTNAARLPHADRPDGLHDLPRMLQQVRAALDRLEDHCQRFRPGGEITAQTIRPELYHYLAIMELVKDNRALYRRIVEQLHQARPVDRRAGLVPHAARPRYRRCRLKGWEANRVLGELFAARDLQEYWEELLAQAEPTAIDTCYRLFRRFLPYQSLPGRAAPFLADLVESARQWDQQEVTSEQVIERFVHHTGLPPRFVQDQQPLQMGEVAGYFQRQVVGQLAAVQAVASVVTTFKAGLNDPQRPLGVLLFCGPTGVGKTELAKTLARYLFGHGAHGERLIRLDMSEYFGWGAAGRLLAKPDGTLSDWMGQVQQQPFNVVLLDEIEKAAPEVFDLLLGLLDEGRLTGPYGRTTNFCSTIVVMTSNLGASRQASIGFSDRSAQPYEAEVRSFFRPEFYNRIDRVLTFHPLSPETCQAITRKCLDELVHREGLAKRRLSLSYSEALVSLLAREGFDPRYGARPLQRTLEHRVVGRIAHLLVEQPTLYDAHLQLDATAAGQILVNSSTTSGVRPGTGTGGQSSGAG